MNWLVHFRPNILGLIAVLILALRSPNSLALGLSVPVGSDVVPLPAGQVLCGEPSGGWQVGPNATSIRPPTDTSQIGKTTIAPIAPTASNCASTKDFITFTVTGPIPIVTRHSVDLWVDEGRVELTGSNLDGSRLEWENEKTHGSDVCVASTAPDGQQICDFSVSKEFSANWVVSSFKLFPAGAAPRTDIFDAIGRRLTRDALSLNLGRTIITQPLFYERHIDLSNGEDHISLRHPEAIASVECDNGRCELVDQSIQVRSVTGSARSMTLKLRLIPHVFVPNGNTFTQNVNVPIDITYCPLAVVSPPPMRDTDDVRVVVRANARCGVGKEGTRFSVNGVTVPILERESKGSFEYVLLGVGRITTERLTVTAMRGPADSSVIGLTSTLTAPAPQLRTSLRLRGFGEIDFVPTNREATVSATAPNTGGQIVVLPVEGAYVVHERNSQTTIQGDVDGGYVVLRFALRDATLPGHLARAELAHFNGKVQRALKEVNIAAPIGLRNTKNPIAEVLCTGPDGHPISVIPGLPLHVPFAQRDGCRLVLHRERIPPEDGEQRLNVTVDVNSVSGSTRSDGHFNERLLLRHGTEPRIIWLRGVKSQFDRITVQLAHVTDESQYIHGGGERVEVPAGQWTIITENIRWRLYATAAIPVQLFRFSNDPSGAGTGTLSLNLGVLTRFTWVTREGTEGILGLEGGVMGMGLSAENNRKLNIVSGLGFGVPLGNTGQTTQASINIHAWAAYRLGNEFATRLDSSGNPISGQFVKLRHWSFIFGPSVTFGNLGFDI